jgi:hypothetical protein
MLKIRFRYDASCKKHPRFNPEKDGEGGIKAGCSDCHRLLEIYRRWLELDRLTKAEIMEEPR